LGTLIPERGRYVRKSRPGAIAFGKAVEAYALFKQNRTRDAVKLFGEAKKQDKLIGKLASKWQQGNIPWPKKILK
jgi:hypothetical protein